jgi:hypothetical protein
MKLKALLLVLAVAGLAASFGLTATGRGDTGTTTGTTSTTTTTTTTTTWHGDCRPFWLTGAFASISTGSFTINPMQGRREKAKTAPTATPVTIALTQGTHVFWQGKGTLAGPGVGDIAQVYGKQCGSVYTAWAVRVRLTKGSEDKAKHGSGEQKQGSDEHPTATEGHSRPKR